MSKGLCSQSLCNTPTNCSTLPIKAPSNLLFVLGIALTVQGTPAPRDAPTSSWFALRIANALEKRGNMAYLLGQ